MPTSPSFITDDHDADSAAVLAGLGFAQMVAPLGEPWLKSGHLVRVLARHDPEPWPIFVYRVQRAPVPARVRLVNDASIEVLR